MTSYFCRCACTVEVTVRSRYSSEKVRSFTPDEVALLERLAVWLAGSIAAIRAEQYERLLKTSKGGA
ncbi:MAG: hypothetical protein WA742_11195 [Candidatus Cybelea sp.]